MAEYVPNGIGGTTGDSLVTASPLYMSGTIWYVDSSTGDDTYTGTDRKFPFATLGAAVSAGSAGDMIVLLGTHDETLTAAVAVSAQTSIIGEGSSSGTPTAQLTLNHATADMLTFSALGCELKNVLINEPSQSTTGTMITVGGTGDGFRAENVHINMNANNATNAVAFSAAADHCRLVDCVLTSTATAVASKPFPAILIGGNLTHFHIDGCTFDGGTVGFEDGSSNNWAVDGSSFDVTTLQIHGTSLLRGANMKFSSSTTGYVHIATATGSSRVEW